MSHWRGPTIKPYLHFNAKQDADTLHKAMKGFGSDKAKIIQVLCARSNNQRQQIAREFKVHYGKDLSKELKSELKGDFEELIISLMEPPVHFICHQLRKAMKGLGTRENVLTEVLVTYTNEGLQEIKHVYHHLFDRSLEKDIISETSGDYQRLLVSLLAAGRDESRHTDHHKAFHDAQRLFKAGEAKRGTDEDEFIRILATQNFDQLRVLFDEYHRYTGHSIEKAIEGEFSGDVKEALLALILRVRNRTTFFATQLYKSMEGMGTRETDLIRIVVSRSEIDLVDIKVEYQCLYAKPLEKAIADDTSGDFKEGLIALVKGN
ncbi:annexin [Aphelenchoides avenae]|nr:annexin [Aphelenchus avenae]